KNSFVQQHNVEFALQRRNVGKKLREVCARPQHEQIVRALVFRRAGIRADGTLWTDRFQSREKTFARSIFLRGVDKRKYFGSEPRLKMAAHGGPRKIVNVCCDAMRWQNHEAFGVRVDESHHRGFVRCVWISRTGLRAALVAIIERSFVAMMAICDDKFLI